MLFDIFKGAVFPKILGFKQYFWFPAVNGSENGPKL